MHSRFNQDTAADLAVPAGWIGAILQCWISCQESGQGCDHRWHCTSKVSRMDAEHLSCFSRDIKSYTSRLRVIIWNWGSEALEQTEFAYPLLRQDVDMALLTGNLIS